ncbi:MAG: hypothetical protein ACI4VQ_07455 [Clostridia bacterium]
MRFLLCFVHTPESRPSLQLRVCPLKYATSPDDVTYPLNTVTFAFAEAESANALYEELIVFEPVEGIGLGNMRFKPMKDSRIYFVGSKVIINGKTYVRNSHTGTLCYFPENGKYVVVPE